MSKNNYAVMWGTETNGARIFVQVHGVPGMRWQALCESPHGMTFETAQREMRRVDPTARYCPDLRRHFSDGSRRWAMYYRNYQGPVILDGCELGGQYLIETNPLQIERV